MNSTTYLYDGSFEGLLHAVAAAIKSKQNVRGIYPAKGFTPHIFDPPTRVRTDRQQAIRLFEYLRKLGGDAARYTVNGYLSEDREVGIHLYQMVQESLSLGPKTTQLYTHDSIKYLDRQSRKVSHEAHRLNGLIRFRIFDDGLQYAPFEPDCMVIGYCARHFTQRLRNQRWILHDVRRNLALYWNRESLQPVDIDQDFTSHVRLHGEIPKPKLSGNERFYQDLWKAFHSAISNANRTNVDLQRRFMPHRYWKYLVEMK